MKIRVYNEDDEYREIEFIEYTQYNGKDTVVDYFKESDGQIYTINFEGWLSIQEIINKFMELEE